MASILGGQWRQPRSILGGYAPIRQMGQGQPMQPQTSPFAMPAGPPAYGSDEWAMATGGPGAMLWREIARAMAGGGHPLAFLDSDRAGKFFSPMSRSILGG